MLISPKIDLFSVLKTLILCLLPLKNRLYSHLELCVSSFLLGLYFEAGGGL